MGTNDMDKTRCKHALCTIEVVNQSATAAGISDGQRGSSSVNESQPQPSSGPVHSSGPAKTGPTL